MGRQLFADTFAAPRFVGLTRQRVSRKYSLVTENWKLVGEFGSTSRRDCLEREINS